VSLQRFDEQTATISVGQIPAGDTSAYNTISAGLKGGRLDQLYLSNNDVIGHVIQLILNDEFGHLAVLGMVNVPSGAGYTAASVEAVSSIQPTGEDGFVLQNAAVVQIQCLVAVTLTNQIDWVAFGGQF